MSTQDKTIVIKKYANRRLYNTSTSTYVTLEDLSTMVKQEEDFIVIDAKSGEDITRLVLTQIIFEEESKGIHLLPVPFLRQLIRFYGDQIQSLIPTFLETSLASFMRDQDKFREQMKTTFGGDETFDLVEKQARQNLKLFEQALQMFSPFAERDTSAQAEEPDKESAKQENSEALSVIQQQLADMQQQIDRLSSKKDE